MEHDRRHRVLLVREWDVQTSGSGCCGRLDGEAVSALTERDTPYTRTRAEMESFGAVYRALRERFPEDELDLTVVDPRNVVWLVPTIWRDARRRGLSVYRTLRQVGGGTSSRALVCDGKVLIAGTVPGPRRAVDAVQRDLAASPRGASA